MRGVRVSRNVVAIVSSLLFVVLALLLIVVPVPFVTWRPGNTVNVLGSNGDGPLLEVEGIQNYPTEASQLLMTTVSTTRVESRVSLPEALLAHLRPQADALPREALYPAGLTEEEVRETAVAAMDTSRTNATVAALRAAPQSVTEMPQVSSVTLSGPANDRLQPGDLIESVDGEQMETAEQVRQIVAGHEAGDPVVFTVLRDDVTESISVTVEEDPQGRPSVGINVSAGYRYAPDVVYRVDSSVVGPSAGLVFSLAIYDKITEGSLVGDEIVAGTGTMDPDGNVGAVGGVRQKLAGSERDGAGVFLLPQANCSDVDDLSTDMRLVPVSTLKDAISALQLIDESTSFAEVPTCG